MIGSVEFQNQKPSENAYVPLVDGSLIRFDKEGFLEVTCKFNMVENFLQSKELRLSEFHEQG